MWSRFPRVCVVTGSRSGSFRRSGGHTNRFRSSRRFAGVLAEGLFVSGSFCVSAALESFQHLLLNLFDLDFGGFHLLQRSAKFLGLVHDLFDLGKDIAQFRVDLDQGM